MEIMINKYILAVITLDHALIKGGGAPIFLAKDRVEQDRIATYIARITESIVHDLENGVYILVRH